MIPRRFFNFRRFFYPLGTYTDKLMAHWIEFYDRNKVDESQKYPLSIDEILVLCLMILFGSRGLSLNLFQVLRESHFYRLFSGAVFHLIEASAFNVETLFFIWSSNYLAVLQMSRLCQVRHFRWLEVCKVLQGKNSAKTIGEFT